MSNKRVFRNLSASLLVGGIALSNPALAAEGLYSADGLTDANVYDSSGKDVGEVEDILLGDDMSVHSIILETGGVLGMGGRELVVERGNFTVQPTDGKQNWDDIDYEVHIDATQDEIKQYPQYDEGWWNQTSQALANAWENTKETTANAWENTKEATSSAWQNTKDAVESMTDEAEEEADQM